jgi:hypothetical protein
MAQGTPELSRLLTEVNSQLPRAALTKAELSALLALDPDRAATPADLAQRSSGTATTTYWVTW